MTDQEPVAAATEPENEPQQTAVASETNQAGAVDATNDAAAAASEAAGAGATTATTRTAELEVRIAELERQLAHEREAATDYMNRWQRAQADFANFKRRAQQDQEQMRRALAAEAARLMLPALDSLDRAFATLPPTLRGFTWIDGIALVEQQLAQMLGLTGVQPITAEPGQPFDPSKHEAIGEVESAEHPVGNVAAVVQRGYQIEGYVLRPALVQLAKAKAAETATDSPSPEDGDIGTQPAAASSEGGGEDSEPSAS